MFHKDIKRRDHLFLKGRDALPRLRTFHIYVSACVVTDLKVFLNDKDLGILFAKLIA